MKKTRKRAKQERNRQRSPWPPPPCTSVGSQRCRASPVLSPRPCSSSMAWDGAHRPLVYEPPKRLRTFRIHERSEVAHFDVCTNDIINIIACTLGWRDIARAAATSRKLKRAAGTWRATCRSWAPTGFVKHKGLRFMISSCPRLQQIALHSRRNINDVSIPFIAQRCRELRQLHLADCHALSNVAIQALASFWV